MSARNVEVVRRMLAQYGPREPQAMQEFVAEFWDADADYYPVRKFPDAHARHGVREIAAFFAGFGESWETFEFLPLAIESCRELPHRARKATRS